VRELNKPHGKKCVHQRFRTGCAVYHKPDMPKSCAMWNCRWLVENDTADLKRPDHSHYVIDLVPDMITLDHGDGNRFDLICVQIWIDPLYPHAHNDPALRAYIERRAAEGEVALVRFDSRRSLTIFAPPLSEDGQWHEIAGSADPSYKGLWNTRSDA
jgi:hypothetical protein